MRGLKSATSFSIYNINIVVFVLRQLVIVNGNDDVAGTDVTMDVAQTKKISISC